MRCEDRRCLNPLAPTPRAPALISAARSICSNSFAPRASSRTSAGTGISTLCWTLPPGASPTKQKRSFDYMKKPPKAHLTPRGQYEAKGIDPDTGLRKSYYGKSAEEASDKARRSLRAPWEADRGTLYDYYRTAYLPSVAMRSDNWLAQICWAMDKHVLPAIGHRPVSELRRPELQAFFNSLNRTLAPKSVDNVRKVVSGIVKLAYDDELLARNPLDSIRLPKIPPSTVPSLSFGELGALALSAHDLIRPVVLLCGFAGGLRVGEACALTRGHLKGEDLQVRQRIHQRKGPASIVPVLKTEHSARDIPLPAALRAALLACNQVSDVFIASNSDGGYLLPKNTAEELAATCEVAGIQKVSAHPLRHTFISLMENELEAPPAIVAYLTGKKDRRNIGPYSHSRREQLLKWMTLYWETAIAEGEKFINQGLVRQEFVVQQA